MAGYPTPKPGLVIRYAYLWRDEAVSGCEEGAKDRPCAIVLAVADQGGETVVTVAPITHSPPSDPDLAVEIAAATKARLGLDDARSWIIVSEVNRFVWPGPDLRPIRPGEPASVAYGFLPASLMARTRQALVTAYRARRASTVTRTE